jgi:hypothetical protein
LPVEIVAAGLIGRLVPTGDVEVVQSRRFGGQQVLLNGTRDVEIVIDLRQFALQLGFAYRQPFT